MCRLFPRIPILKAFYFVKKVLRDARSDIYHDSLSSIAALYTTVRASVLFGQKRQFQKQPSEVFYKKMCS